MKKTIFVLLCLTPSLGTARDAAFLRDYTNAESGVGLTAGFIPDVTRMVLPELASSDPAVRIRTARALGWTGSEIAFIPLHSVLQVETGSVRYAAAAAIGRLGDARSLEVLTHCLSDGDFALRLAAVNGLRALGRPLQAAWVKPVIVSGGENIPTFYQAIELLRIYGGDQAAPGLTSCLHFDDPSVRHEYNFRLILALEYSPNGPKYYYKWHHDPNRDGTEAELADSFRAENLAQPTKAKLGGWHCHAANVLEDKPKAPVLLRSPRHGLQIARFQKSSQPSCLPRPARNERGEGSG